MDLFGDIMLITFSDKYLDLFIRDTSRRYFDPLNYA